MGKWRPSASSTENVLICKKGFPRHRRVLLLCEELYYDEDFESFRVLRVNFPLLGKVPRAYMEAVQVSQVGIK